MVRVEVHASLGRHRTAWDELVLAQQPPPLELRSWYLEAIASSESRFLLALDQDRLIGGLAAELTPAGRNVTRIRLLGWWLAEADILSVPDDALRVTDAFRRWFASQDHVVIDLDGVRANSMLRAALPETIHEADVPGAPYLPIEGRSWSEYMDSRSTKFAADIRRQIRRLERGGVVYRRLEPDEHELGLCSLRDLHFARFGERSAFAPFYERFARSVPLGSERGELVFHVLMAGDRIIANKSAIECDGYVIGIQSGMVDRTEKQFNGAGTVVLAKLVEDACERGFHEVDLGREPNAEKARWTDHVREVKHLTGSWGWRPALADHVGSAKHEVRRLARGVRRRLPAPGRRST